MVLALAKIVFKDAKRAACNIWSVAERWGLVTARVKAATLSDIEPRIDQYLSSGLSYLQLPADIRASFRKTTRRGRRAWIANWSLCIAVFNLLTAVFDPGMLQGAALQRDLLLRLLVSASFAAVTLVMKFGRPRYLDEAFACVPPVLAVICAGFAGMGSPSIDILHHFLTMAVTVVCTAVILLPIELLGTLCIASATFIIMSGFLLVTFPHCLAEEAQNICFCGSVLGALIYARHIQNKNEYRLFLMKKKKDITLFQQTSHNAVLSSIAYTDPLTDIPNRRYFTELIEAIEVNPKLYLPLSICMMDIDAFKNLNDQYGHGEGDRCLRAVAGTIRKHLRQNNDAVARYGGEEFVLVLPHTSAERANEVAERMRLAVLDLDYPNPGTPLGYLSLSTGIAVAYEPAQVRNLVEAADLALYQAKAAGRNRTVVTVDAP